MESARHCLTDALRISIEHAHEEVKRAATESAQRGGMGSTLVAGVIAGNAAYVSHVGDSRLYLCRDGILERVTKDHTLYQHAIDHGTTLLDEASAQHVLLQAIGQPRPLDFRVERICLHPGDLLLLCSDGLTGAVSDQELQQELTHSVGLDVISSELIALANARGGNDNVTIVLARVQAA